MSKSAPRPDVEALVQKARELYPKSVLKITYYGSGDSPDGDDLQVGEDYISEPNQELMELARELMYQGGADYNNEGGGGTIEIDTANLTCKRQEYNNVHQQVYEDEETWQVW